MRPKNVITSRNRCSPRFLAGKFKTNCRDRWFFRKSIVKLRFFGPVRLMKTTSLNKSMTTINSRSCDFLNNLYEEKLLHKKNRHEYVKQKFIFVIGLFSLGSLKTIGILPKIDLSVLLYFIPYVASSYDIYIAAEDFKVKRVGTFIRRHAGDQCYEEKAWERWLNDKEHRESLALWASVCLTVISLLASALLLFPQNTNRKIFFTWLAISLVACISVFLIAKSERNILNKSKEKIAEQVN